MAIPFFGKKYLGKLSVFTGFEQVFPVLNPGGSERFGVIELSPETSRTHGRLSNLAGNFLPSGKKRVAGYTGVLRLSGPAQNQGLTQGKDTTSFFEALTRSLPSDSPAQFLMRRRNYHLENHYNVLQEKILRRLPDEEITDFFLQDYLDNMVYPLEAGGLGKIWYGLLVSAPTIETLTGHMAVLVANLPCEASPCSATEITALLLDHYAPLLLEQFRAEGTPLPRRFSPEALNGADLTVLPGAFHHGLTSTYWKVSAPPLSHPQGWTFPLLANPKLVNTEFDLTVHLTPANRDDKLCVVLERRLAFLDEQLETAFTRQATAIIDDLQEQRQEVAYRLESARCEDNRFFEAGITFSLRANRDDLERVSRVFEAELKNLGLAARPTFTAAETRAALLEIAPLNLPQGDRPLVLPGWEAGQLAHLHPITAPDYKDRETLVGLSQLNEPVFFDPAVRPGQTAFFLLGEPGKATTHQARTLVRYQTIFQWLKGEAVCGLDRKGEWEDLVKQFGGRYVRLGPDEPDFNFNPLEVEAENLRWNSSLSEWLNETAAFLADLLKLDTDLQQDLLASLFEAAMALLNRNEPFNAASLWMRAENGGYGLLAERLKELTKTGRYGWLCAHPTRVPQTSLCPDLLFIGLSPTLQSLLGEEQQKFYFARLFARFAGQLWAENPDRSRLLVLNQAHEFLADPVSARSLGWLEQRSKPAGLRLWLVSPSPAEWLNSYYGRELFDRAGCHLFFQQGQNVMAPVARRLGLSPTLVKAVREARPGAAIVRQTGEDGQVDFFSFEAPNGDYFDRFALASGRLTTPKPSQTRRDEPEEVPLFAPDEIWDENDLPDRRTPAETIEVAAVSYDETALTVIA
ncbi:MAG: hypothetical protein J0I20_10255 [Chloroflexi bacterium]|nr:hypothetical protein [Chloroflexota bacterium]OJV94526.1 MAG: hypothetical protein BGO39_22555 [Chloroflexi bacterium 54-19]